MEKLDRAEPSGLELQLPAGRVQAEQPSPHPLIVLYSRVKNTSGVFTSYSFPKKAPAFPPAVPRAPGNPLAIGPGFQHPCMLPKLHMGLYGNAEGSWSGICQPQAGMHGSVQIRIRDQCAGRRGAAAHASPVGLCPCPQGTGRL